MPVTRIGYHATNPLLVESIEKNGFLPGVSPGRLGNNGVYVNNTTEGAVKEFFHNRKDAKESIVLEVEYQPGVESETGTVPAKNYGFINKMKETNNPQPHTRRHFPFSNNVDTVTAPSLRARGTKNTNVLNGTVRPTGNKKTVFNNGWAI